MGDKVLSEARAMALQSSFAEPAVVRSQNEMAKLWMAGDLLSKTGLSDTTESHQRDGPTLVEKQAPQSGFQLGSGEVLGQSTRHIDIWVNTTRRHPVRLYQRPPLPPRFTLSVCSSIQSRGGSGPCRKTAALGTDPGREHRLVWDCLTWLDPI